MTGPVRDPRIPAGLAQDLLQIQSRHLEWMAQPTPGGFDDHIIETMLEMLDAHARAYLESVIDESSFQQFAARLRQTGSVLLSNQEASGLLSNPYNQAKLREEMKLSRSFRRKSRSLTSEQREALLCEMVDDYRLELRQKESEWRQWKNEIGFRIETRFEARYRNWVIEAMNRRKAALKSVIAPDSANPDVDTNEGEIRQKLGGHVVTEGASPHVRKKKGRPVKIDVEKKTLAAQARAARKSWKEVAKILYATRYPSVQQVKNAPNILNHFLRSRSPEEAEKPDELAT
jgi:hypothetical protein